MEYVYIMSFISWMIMILMLTGFSLVSSLELELRSDNLSDEEKINVEGFLMGFYDADFFGKVNFIILHGARAWGIGLNSIFRKKK